MKLSRLNRVIHRWGSIAIALPTLIVLVSGVVLQWKKQSSWIQPKTWAGTNQAPQISFPDVLAIVKSVPEAGVQSWAEIDRLDVRPSKGMLKVRCKNRWEIQLDAVTGDVLQVAYRRSDLIESVHDGSFFSDFVKLGVFLPTAIVLLVLWGTGIYLFFLPHLAKRKQRLRKGRRSKVTSGVD
ncbi:MAG: PepSY domain-containing protein [Rubripirellula sp.]|nr:PepSY domain-containing protein [Rubripirellula sp.]